MFLAVVKAIALKQKPSLKLDALLSVSLEPYTKATNVFQQAGLNSFLGASEEDKLAISQKSLEILKGALETKLMSNRPEALKDLSAQLQDQTFLATNYLSMADLVLFSLLYKSVPLGPQDRLDFSNIVRYYDLVQHQVLYLASPELLMEIRDFNLEVPFVEKKVPEKERKTAPADKKGGKDLAAKVEEKNLAPKQAPKQTEKEGAGLDPSKLDVRVGKILNVEKHPEADSLYVETIDVGEQKPRTVVSGLVKYMKDSDLLNQYVCLLCNLKPAKMRGIESAAMVLCANSGDGSVVELLAPPTGSKPGDTLKFENFPGAPEALLKPKQKIWEGLQPCLFTNEKMEATFVDPITKKAHVLKNSSGSGVVSAKSLTIASIK